MVEMATAIGVPKATAYRLARTLEAAGYIVLDPPTARYHLGPSAVALTYLSGSYAELVRMARPYLEDLAKSTGETVNLAVELDGKAILVDEIRTKRPFKSEIPVGRVIGDIANTNGKLFAAFKTREERERIAMRPNEKATPYTVTDPTALLEEFEAVRAAGLAFDMEERSRGVCAVGAAVRDQSGRLVAAISVVAPKSRFRPDEREAHASAVREAADRLSAFLGYSPSEA